MAQIGMDPEVVEGIGHQLKGQGQAIQNVVNAIQHLISQAEGAWKGQDAQEFNNWWQSQHRPALLKAMEAIDGLGQSALNNASAQRTASSH